MSLSLSLSCLLVEDESSQEKDYLGWGSTDGTFQEQQYFTCQRNHGLFVSVEKLFPLGQPSARGQPAGRERGIPQASGFRYKISDRVVAFTRKGNAVHGTVKWVGLYTCTINKEEHSWRSVGIETVSKTCHCSLSVGSYLTLPGCEGKEK